LPHSRKTGWLARGTIPRILPRNVLVFFVTFRASIGTESARFQHNV